MPRELNRVLVPADLEQQAYSTGPYVHGNTPTSKNRYRLTASMSPLPRPSTMTGWYRDPIVTARKRVASLMMMTAL